MNHYFSRRFVMNYLLSYMIILIIAVSLSFIGFNYALGILEEEVQHSNLLMLRQNSSIVDGRMKEIDNTIKEISLNNKINMFLNVDSPLDNKRTIQNVKNAQETIIPYGYSSQFIKAMMIYSRSADSIISPFFTEIRPETSYGYLFGYNDMDFFEWKEIMLDQKYSMKVFPSQQSIINNEDSNVITLTHSLPSSGFNSIGTIIFQIDEKVLHSLLGTLQVENGGYVYIEGLDGKVITTYTDNMSLVTYFDIGERQKEGYFTDSIQGHEVMVSYTTSSINGWKYVGVIPKEVVVEKVNRALEYYLIISLTAICIGFVISLYLANRHGKPIGHIASNLNEFFSDKLDHNYYNMMELEGSVTELIGDNRELKGILMEQQPLLKKYFYQSLLDNRYSNEEEIKLHLNGIRADICNIKSVRILLLEIEGNDEAIGSQVLTLEAAKVFIANVLHNRMEEVLYVLDKDSKTQIIFVESDVGDERFVENMTVFFYEVRRELLTKHDISINLAGSKRSVVLSECHKVFEEAQFAMDYSMNRDLDSVIAWYKDENDTRIGCYYPIRIQEQIMNITKKGSVSKLESLLDEVYEVNIERRQLSKGTGALRQLGYCIIGTLYELVEIIDDDSSIKQILENLTKRLEKRDDFEEIFIELKNLFVNVCNNVNEVKKQKKDNFGARTVQFIENNYDNNQLSLKFVSEKMERSTTTVINAVKEYTGLTFAQYLEDVRIKAACQYLKDGKSVSEIAELIGYSNAQVFRRAFKRVTGVNPSSYNE